MFHTTCPGNIPFEYLGSNVHAIDLYYKQCDKEGAMQTVRPESVRPGSRSGSSASLASGTIVMPAARVIAHPCCCLTAQPDRY